jgi:hypothetical protein
MNDRKDVNEGSDIDALVVNHHPYLINNLGYQ